MLAPPKGLSADSAPRPRKSAANSAPNTGSMVRVTERMMAQPTAFMTPAGSLPGAVSCATTTQPATRSCRAWRRTVKAAIRKEPRITTVPISPNSSAPIPPISQVPSRIRTVPAK